MRVAVTGISSYTGMCVAREFAHRGHFTIGLLSGLLASYQGRKRIRLGLLAREGVRLEEELRAENGKMAAWVAEERIDLWVHHHHPMDGFRSAEYDVGAARGAAVEPLPALANAWTQAGVRSVLFSGTYFEPGEGGRASDSAVTPYARLKGRVSDEVERHARSRDIAFGKVVIASPTGALENADRLTPGLLMAALENREFVVRSPNSVFDHIPGEKLASVYADLGESLTQETSVVSRTCRPSGWRVSARDWVEWARESIVEPLGLNLGVRFVAPEEESSPSVFENPASEAVDCDWDQFAAAYVREWRENYPFR